MNDDSGNDNEHAGRRGPELTEEGTLTGPLRVPEAPLPDANADSDPPLELKPMPKALPWAEPAPYRDDSPPKSSWPKRVVVALMAAGIIALVYLAVTAKRPAAHQPVAEVAANPLPLSPAGAGAGFVVIDSEPAGATVFIRGQKVGTTPWASDNAFSGPVKYELTMQGYRRAFGTFQGKQEAKIRVALTAETPPEKEAPAAGPTLAPATDDSP